MRMMRSGIGNDCPGIRPRKVPLTFEAVIGGRAPVDWTLSDALRLVNLLTTLVFLFVTVGQPKLEAPK
jgi:hypothetical protein